MDSFYYVNDELVHGSSEIPIVCTDMGNTCRHKVSLQCEPEYVSLKFLLYWHNTGSEGRKMAFLLCEYACGYQD